MKPVLALCLCVAVNPVLHAQNLVPNGSFEEYTDCPSTFGYAQYATGWQKLHTNSADYFNRCQTNLVAGVPFNTCGYQEPADGDGYVGMATTFPGLPWYREIVGRELAAPLQVGVPVCISFRVAVGGFGSWDGGSAINTAKGIGLRFFNGFPVDWLAFLYPNNSALALEVVPTDTVIWYAVSGVYIPDSAYTHVAIGNFFDDAWSEITILDSSGYGIADVSYAFVDDVRVSLDLGYCVNAVGDALNGPNATLMVYPQPFTDRFHVALGRRVEGTLRWSVRDAAGRLLMSGIERSCTTRFDVEARALPQGTYLFTATDDAGAFAPVRVFSLAP